MENMSFRKLRNFSLFLLVTVVVHVAIFRSKIFLDKPILVNGEGLSSQVLSILKNDFLYKDKIDDEKIYYGSIKGQVSSLGDPYTVFLPPDENKTSQENLAGEFGGVGVSLGYKEGSLAVMSPLAKTPADRAGLRAGDLILKIKDEKAGIDVDTQDISIQRAVELIRGEIGTKVVLSIFRQGENEARDVELIRDNIVVASVEIENLDHNGKKISWIKMYKFSDRLYEEWEEMVSSVLANNSEVIILDLRNNPGGYLDGSVLIASDFLEDGVVVKQKSADGSVEEYKVEKGKSRLVGKKLVVLINGGSASAAEILAGALKQRINAPIVGETSFGKGTVQKTDDFADGSGLHVTIAKWLLPSGDDIDQKGVEPDYEVEWEYDDEIDRNKIFEIDGLLN